MEQTPAQVPAQINQESLNGILAIILIASFICQMPVFGVLVAILAVIFIRPRLAKVETKKEETESE